LFCCIQLISYIGVGVVHKSQLKPTHATNQDTKSFVIILYFVDAAFNLDVAASSSVLELKEAIQKETGVVPNEQELYCLGLHLDEADTKITDYLEVSKTFNLVLPDEDADKGIFGRKTPFSCDKDVFIRTGGILDFKSIPLKANTDEKIKLKSKKFGVAQDIKGEHGQRVFQVKIYNAGMKGSISLMAGNEGNKVYLTTNQGEIELESMETQTYDEKLMKKKSPLDHLKVLINIITGAGNSQQ
jgi:hypothetical protein